MELMIAARHCNQWDGTDRVKIVSASRRQPLKGDLFSILASEGRETLHALSDNPELAAHHLRQRLKIHTYRIDFREMKDAVRPAEIIEADIKASGYLVPKDTLKPNPIVVLRKSDSQLRKRFTLAHEIGHAIINEANWRRPHDEERWCDAFAAALLMPIDRLRSFERTANTLSDYMCIPEVFEVSRAVAARRLEEICKKYLIFSQDHSLSEDVPVEILDRVQQVADLMAPPEERPGYLSNGLRFIIRKWSSTDYMAVVDLSPDPVRDRH